MALDRAGQGTHEYQDVLEGRPPSAKRVALHTLAPAKELYVRGRALAGAGNDA